MLNLVLNLFHYFDYLNSALYLKNILKIQFLLHRKSTENSQLLHSKDRRLMLCKEMMTHLIIIRKAVGIATSYGLDGPGFECRWCQLIFPLKTTGPTLRPTQPIHWVPAFFPGGQDMKLTYLHLMLRLIMRESVLLFHL